MRTYSTVVIWDQQIFVANLVSNTARLIHLNTVAEIFRIECCCQSSAFKAPVKTTTCRIPFP